MEVHYEKKINVYKVGCSCDGGGSRRRCGRIGQSGNETGAQTDGKDAGSSGGGLTMAVAMNDSNEFLIAYSNGKIVRLGYEAGQDD